MKLKKIVVENVKSFKERKEIEFNNSLNILIGPNAGGKSNLLDIINIILRHFFVKFYRLNSGNESGRLIEDIAAENIFHPIGKYLDKYVGNEGNASVIEISFVVTRDDIENIEKIYNTKDRLQDILSNEIRNKPIQNLGFMESWKSDEIPENTILTYRIENNTLIGSTDAHHKIFLEYLNHFEIFNILSKKINGTIFSLSQASSGEKEILNFLLGIFSYNVKNGLIIIDEPELHLHPKWQNTLVDLYSDLSGLNNNQFLIVTHSPVFISEKIIESVFRLYRKDNMTEVVQPPKTSIPETKDLLHIVNSLNNEKIFFADKVVLVEGLSDRLIFQRLIEKLQDGAQEILEFLQVQGKNSLQKYRDFLNLFEIKNYIIADFDYLSEIGDKRIKEMFITDYKRIDEKAIKDKVSRDGKSLALLLRELLNKESLNKEDTQELDDLLKYIESRYKKLKENINPEESTQLESFIEAQKNNNIHILKHGEIEDYLPSLSKNNKIESVVNFLTSGDFDKWFDDSTEDEKKKELLSIIYHILGTFGESSNEDKSLVTKEVTIDGNN